MKGEMMDDFGPVAEAFTRKGRLYDEFGRNHPNLDYIRSKVYRHLLAYHPPGAHLLEINAGTGVDAVYLARQGIYVHATDISPGMIEALTQKVEAQGLHEWISVQQCSFTDLEGVTGGPYDGIFSNLGGLNCTNDLQAITRKLPAVLKPGAYVTWVVMPRICLWELSAALRGDLKTAIRRIKPGGTIANVEGVSFRAYYYFPKDVRRAFSQDFRYIQLQGLSVFTPPIDHKGFATKWPKLYSWLRRLEHYLADQPPFNHLGDFYILTMRYLPTSNPGG
jgi:ubiquinone/menaquinone biosynthesis C-methylase UbiE